MAAHSSILAWRIPWTEEPSGLQSMGSRRIGHDFLVTKQQQQAQMLRRSRSCGSNKRTRTKSRRPLGIPFRITRSKSPQRGLHGDEVQAENLSCGFLVTVA